MKMTQLVKVTGVALESGLGKKDLSSFFWVAVMSRINETKAIL